MNKLKDYLNDILIEYEETRGEVGDNQTFVDYEQLRMALIEEYLVYIKKRLIGE